MAVAVDIQVPGMTAEQYDQLVAMLAPSLTDAPGFLAHSSGPVPGGWRIAELWSSAGEYSVMPRRRSFRPPGLRE